VRERFAGARRNPFDEAECGHHYARALASWGLIVALTGFSYDGRSGVMPFARAPGSGRRPPQPGVLAAGFAGPLARLAG
jgi:hypothetical protein